MAQQNRAKKKLLGSKIEIFAFLLVISVHGDFEDIFLVEGVGVKAREGLQSTRNTKICRLQHSQVYPELIITDFTGYNGFLCKFTGFR